MSRVEIRYGASTSRAVSYKDIPMGTYFIGTLHGHTRQLFLMSWDYRIVSVRNPEMTWTRPVERIEDYQPVNVVITTTPAQQ